MARSPYLEAEVNRWCKEKKELVIQDCDLDTFNIIINYMYGIPIPDSVQINATAKNRKVELKQIITLIKLVKLLEVSDRFLMVDLKDEVEGLLLKEVERPMPRSLFFRIVNLAEDLSCDKLLAACAKYLASRLKGSTNKKGFDQGKLATGCTQTIETTPKFAAALLMAAFMA